MKRGLTAVTPGLEYKEMFAIHTQKMTVSYEQGTYVKKP